MGKIRAIRMRVAESPVEVMIDSGLASLQSEVGGRIELVSMDAEVDAYVNEEGLLEGLPFNGYLPTNYGGIPVVGDVVFVSHDDEGETVGLSEAQVAYWLSRLAAAPRVLSGWPHSGEA